MNVKKDETISKTLTWLLRHAAKEQGIAISDSGFAHLEDLLKHDQLHGVSTEDVKRVVQNCPKQRFTLKEDGGFLVIAANQGHSMQVINADLVQVTDASEFPVLIHGTYSRCWPSIRRRGLHRMQRQHIHLAPGEPGESGVISGMRSSCDVLIYVDLTRALADGLRFSRSANNVILCPGDADGYLEPRYFARALRRKTREVLYPATDTPDSLPDDLGQSAFYEN